MTRITSASMRHGAETMQRDIRRDAYDREPDEDEIEVLGRPEPFRRLRFAAQVVCGAVIVAGLTLAARETSHTAPETVAWQDPPTPRALVRVAAPEVSATPLLRLETDPGESTAQAEAPRWNANSGLREDALLRGSFDTIEAPFLRITLAETASPAPPPSLFVTLARRAAEVQGLSVLRTGLRGQVETKFGPFETVETVLGGEGTRSCTGFQSQSTAGLRIDGWLCGILGQAPEMDSVACAIDRLSLAVPAGPTLEALFAEAQQHRLPGCGVASGQSAEVTGSVRNTDQTAATRKNEAQLRRIVQAGH